MQSPYDRIQYYKLTKVPQTLKQRILQDGLLIKGVKALQEQLEIAIL